MTEMIRSLSTKNNQLYPTLSHNEQLILPLVQIYSKCSYLGYEDYIEIKKAFLTSQRLLKLSSTSNQDEQKWIEINLQQVRRIEVTKDDPKNKIKAIFSSGKQLLNKKLMLYSKNEESRISIKFSNKSKVLSDNYLEKDVFDVLFENLTHLIKTQQKATTISKSNEQNLNKITYGVSQLLKQHSENMLEEKFLVSGALKDLQSLQQNAEAMSKLSYKFKQILASDNLSCNTENDEAKRSEVADMLLSFGIADGEIQSLASKAKNSSYQSYLNELQKDLNEFLYYIFKTTSELPKNDNLDKLKIMKQEDQRGLPALPNMFDLGIILLHDLYCLFNRIRGTDLISPKDLIEALKLSIASSNCTFKFRYFGKTKAIQLKARDDQHILRKVFDILEKNSKDTRNVYPSCTVIEVAKEINASYILVSLMLNEYVMNSFLCIDDTIQGKSYYKNIFMN